jgi:hypothetical protein
MTSEMEVNRRTRTVHWGLVFLVSFFYINALLFVSIRAPIAEEGYGYPYVAPFWRAADITLLLSLLCLALPAWRLALHIYDPGYYAELLYYPLLAGIIWFGYGCLIGWSYKTKRLLKVFFLLGGLWALLLYLGWVAGMMYPIPG